MTEITYITAYYELPNGMNKFEDELERAKQCSLLISNPMIIFCEPEMVSRIKEFRDKYGYLTHFIKRRFQDLEFYSYLEQIKQNRVKRPRADGNNIPEYLILKCSKFTMLKEVMEKNIFGSKYFGWIDFGLQSSNKIMETDINVSRWIINNNCEKMRMCFINYIPRKEVEDLEDFYHLYGKCSIAGTFYTGGVKYLLPFVNSCIECFKSNVDKGYGHSDEQIYIQIYFKNPELFDFYFGDYQFVVNNFLEFHNGDTKHIMLNVFLPNLMKDENNLSASLFKNFAKYILDGYKKDKVELDKNEIIKLINYIVS